MPVAANAFVNRDYYPLVGVTDTLVLVFAEHGSATARPKLVLTAGESDTQVVVKSGRDLQINLFTLTETINLPQYSSQVDRGLPITAAATTNIVTVITVTRGKISVTIDSPIQFRSYLQQPMINPPLN